MMKVTFYIDTKTDFVGLKPHSGTTCGTLCANYE